MELCALFHTALLEQDAVRVAVFKDFGIERKRGLILVERFLVFSPREVGGPKIGMDGRGVGAQPQSLLILVDCAAIVLFGVIDSPEVVDRLRILSVDPLGALILLAGLRQEGQLVVSYADLV